MTPKLPIITAFAFVCCITSHAQDVGSMPAVTSEAQGYFPTLAESALLRGAENSRSQGGMSLEGPDRAAQVATDLFPYTDPTPNFYQRNQSFFKPLDQLLGWGTQNDAVTYELDALDNTSLTLDATTGFLNRQYSPELAMVKAGPLYLDVLWVGTGIIWSDFNGAQATINNNGEKNSGDGATAYVDIGLRGLVRFTDTIYFSVVGDLMYLPFENEIALNFGYGRNLGLSTRFNYAETFGAWDILLFDEFQGSPGLNWNGQATRNGVDSAGRYYYGAQNSGRANQFFDQSFVYFTNSLGLRASRLVLNNQWRFGTSVDHIDFWRTFSFENHQKRDHIGLWLGYEGSQIPFSPRIGYDLTSFDGYKSLRHNFYLNLSGRLTENIMWASNVGTMFTTGPVEGFSQPIVWDAQLSQVITNSLSHWVLFGENVYDSQLSNEQQLSRFVSYGVDQRIGRKLQATAFAQFSDRETQIPATGSVNNAGNGNTRSRNSFGVTMNYQPLDFTKISASMLYQMTEQSGPATDSDIWIYRLDASQQLGLRLTALLFYQFEEQKSNRAFNEHVLGFSLRRYF